MSPAPVRPLDADDPFYSIEKVLRLGLSLTNPEGVRLMETIRTLQETIKHMEHDEQRIRDQRRFRATDTPSAA